MASLERMPEKPGQEIVVALAGPAVNLVIAVALAVVLGASFDLGQMAQLEEAKTSLAGRVAAANVALCVFNLIPAFPMDGGRVLRALLAIPMGYTRATRVAATIGQGLAFLFALLGLVVGNPLLILVAVFIFLAASGEAGYVQAREYTRGYLASHAMITSYQTLSPVLHRRRCRRPAACAPPSRSSRSWTAPASCAACSRATRSSRRCSRRGGTTPVLEIMDREIPTVPENACLDNVFERLQRSASAAGGRRRSRPGAWSAISLPRTCRS